MTTISFTKMHGLGNDFVVINHALQLNDKQIQMLSDRHFGIGFDQLLLISGCDNADFFCKIYNPNGSEAEQCGNGLRAVARYLHEEKLSPANEFTIATVAGVFPISIKDYDHITVSLPVGAADIEKVSLPAAETTHELSAVSLGNPHALLLVDNLQEIDLSKIGYSLSTHEHFDTGANIGFIKKINPEAIQLRTFERGAGLTHACGSNACAAFLTGVHQGWLEPRATVAFEFGQLFLEWLADEKIIKMTGSASRVFEGKMALV